MGGVHKALERVGVTVDMCRGKQRDAEAAFEQRQLAADRLRGNAELVCGASDPTFLGNHPEVVQVLVIEIGHDNSVFTNGL